MNCTCNHEYTLELIPSLMMGRYCPISEKDGAVNRWHSSNKSLREMSMSSSTLTSCFSGLLVSTSSNKQSCFGSETSVTAADSSGLGSSSSSSLHVLSFNSSLFESVLPSLVFVESFELSSLSPAEHAFVSPSMSFCGSFFSTSSSAFSSFFFDGMVPSLASITAVDAAVTSSSSSAC